MAIVNKNTEKKLQQEDKALKKFLDKYNKAEDQAQQIQDKIEELQAKRDNELAEIISGNKGDRADVLSLDREISELQGQLEIQSQVLERQEAEISEQKRKVRKVEQEIEAEAKSVWIQRYNETWGEMIDLLDRLCLCARKAGVAGNQQLAQNLYFKTLGAGKGEATEEIPRSGNLTNSERYGIDKQQAQEEAERNTVPPGEPPKVREHMGDPKELIR